MKKTNIKNKPIMTIDLTITPMYWKLIPKKQGRGWGTYLYLTFLCFSLTLDWHKPLQYTEMAKIATPDGN